MSATSHTRGVDIIVAKFCPSAAVDQYDVAENPKTLTLREAEEKVAKFYRAFELPGMEYCMGGPGPNNISASLQPERPKSGPDQDIIEALVNRVEQGRAPNFLVATKYTDDDPMKHPPMTRRLCIFPKFAVWDKNGDSSNYRSFACANPPN